MKKTKTVSFFSLNMDYNELWQNAKGGAVNKYRPVSLYEIKQKFCDVYTNHMNKTELGRAISVHLPSRNEAVIEVLNLAENQAFLTIGQQNNSDTVAIRDQTTYSKKSVPMTANQRLELFTHVLLDFETGIISYIGVLGAPKISAITSMLNSFYEDKGYTAGISAITTRDILQSLMSKDIVGNLCVDIAVPEDRLLADYIKNENDFDALRNVTHKRVLLRLSGSRNKNIFSDKKTFSSFVTSMIEKYGSSLKRLSVTAKNADEKSQTYDILEYSFTKKVEMHVDTITTSSDYFDALKQTYDANKATLVKYANRG